MQTCAARPAAESDESRFSSAAAPADPPFLSQGSQPPEQVWGVPRRGVGSHFPTSDAEPPPTGLRAPRESSRETRLPRSSARCKLGPFVVEVCCVFWLLACAR